MHAAADDPARIAYDAIAPVYDDFSSGYEAASWTAGLAEKAEGLGLGGRRLLDVGCGTGKSTAPMLARGWEVSGCDISAEMLVVARERLGDSVELSVADARELPVFGEFDLVWALNDTLNYLLDDGDLQAALAGMGANLAADGVLLFDLNTISMFRASFSAQDTREIGARRMSWGGLSAADAPAGSTFEARVETSEAADRTHLHRQRHYPEADALEALERAGLRCLEIWGDIEGEQSQPLDEARHQKAIYLAQKMP